MLGEGLYPLVDQLVHDSVAKVTGMRLEIDRPQRQSCCLILLVNNEPNLGWFFLCLYLVHTELCLGLPKTS